MKTIGAVSPYSKPLRNNLDNKDYFKRAHEFGVMAGALKHTNFGFQYQYNIRPIKWVTLQGIAGLKLMNYDIYSASDEHRIQAGWLPISAGARFHFMNTSKLSNYVFGKYGYAIGLGNNQNKMESDNCYEYGIGTILPVLDNSNSRLKIEIGRQEYPLRGRALSSFQSVINYNLLFNSFFFRIGFSFLPSKYR